MSLRFTEWSMGRGSYITLFSPSDVTAFHRMKYGEGELYNLVFTEWCHCVSQNEVWGRGSYITLFSPSDVTAFHRITLFLQSSHSKRFPVTSLRFTELSFVICFIERINHCYWEWNDCWDIKICKCLVVNKTNMSNFHPRELVSRRNEMNRALGHLCAHIG